MRTLVTLLAGTILLSVLALGGGYLTLVPLSLERLRLGFWIAAGAVLALWGLRLWRAFAAEPSAFEVAAYVESRSRDLSDRLRSAVELEAPELSERASAALIGLHLEDAARRVRELDARRLVPLAAARRPAILAGASLATLILALVLDPALSGRIGWLLGSVDEAPALRAGLGEAAVIGAIELDYSFPSYTRLAPRRETNASGHVRALKGTEVQFAAKSDRKLSAAELVFSTGTRVPLRVNERRELQGSFVLAESGHYRLRFTLPGGRSFEDPFEYSVFVEQDALPEVELLEPAGDVEADGLSSLEIAYEASDDFGLGDIELVTEYAGQTERRRIAGAEADSLRQRGRHTWDLGQLRLEPGEAIAFHVEAADNDSVSGPKHGASVTRVVRVRDGDEAHRAVTAAMERLLGELLGALAPALVDTPAFDSPVPGMELLASVSETVAAERRIDERLEAAVQTLDEVLLGLWQDPKGREASYSSLSAVRLRLAELLSEKRAWLKREAPALERPYGDLETRSALVAFRARETQELESAALTVDELVRSERVEDMRQLSESLLADIRRLEELMAQGDRASASEIQQLMARIEAKMAEMSAQLAQLAGRVPDEFLNMDSLADMNGEGRDDLMERIRESLAAGRMDEARELARELAELNARMAAAVGMGVSGWMTAQAREREDAMQQAFQRLEELERRERDVVSDLEQVRRQVDVRKLETTGDIDSFYEREAKRTAEALEAVRSARAALSEDQRVKALAADEARLKELMDSANEVLAARGDAGLPESGEGEAQGLPEAGSAEAARFDALSRELFELRDRVNAHPGRPLERARGALEEATGYLERLGQAIEARALEDAIGVSRSAGMALRDAGYRLGQPGGAGGAAAKVSKADALHEEVNRQLEALDSLLESPANDQLAPAESRRLDELAQRQDDLRTDTQELGHNLQSAASETGMVPPAVGQAIDEAAEFMEGARNGMRGANVDGAVNDSRSAHSKIAEALDRLDEALEESREGASGGRLAFVPQGAHGKPRFSRNGRGGGSPHGAGVDQDRVESPSEADARAPERFRRDVMEAMKAERPPGYGEALERYYRELVR